MKREIDTHRLFVHRRLLWFLLLLAIPGVFAADIEVEKIAKNDIIVAELDNPAVYELIVNNSGENDSFRIYTLVGIAISPKDYIEMPTGITKVEITAIPDEEVRKNRGLFRFEYQMKGRQSGIFKDTLSFEIIEMEDSLEMEARDVDFGDDIAIITMKNVQNALLRDIKVNLNSAFFNEDVLVTLEPFSEQNISVRIDKSRIQDLVAGSYVFYTTTQLGDSIANFSGIIKYNQKAEIVSDEKRKGIIIRKHTITSTNKGNIPAVARIEMDKNSFARLFSVFSIEPIVSERKGSKVSYSWEKELEPGESFSVESTTNYTLPFILVLLIVIIGVFAYIYTRTTLIVNKRVTYVKTKGGEFALKVVLNLRAKKYLDNIQIIDKLPGMTQLYEKFGIKPDKIDTATRRLIWKIERLNAGEERIFSYIIYSKLKVVGRFELPPALVIFDREGKTHEVLSNRTFFLADTVGRL